MRLRRPSVAGPLLLVAIAAGCGRQQESTLRIYLARHGQTDWNAARRLQGGSDTMLNEAGRSQAAALAASLSGIRLDRIYSSALRRSRETAEYLNGRAPVEALATLNEQGLGKFEGAYLDGRDPALADEFKRRSADPDDTLDGGESKRQHLARVRAAIEEIRRRLPAGQILIIGHGGTNALILAVLLDLKLEDVDRFHQANDEVYAIDLVPGKKAAVWKLVPAERLEEL